MRDQRSFIFAPFRLDLGDERLWRDQEAVRLTHKAFAVLQCLVTHAGQLVTKAELFAAVWPETVVSESALLVCIRELRRALGDQARSSQFIETVHGRGYRFIAPVEEHQPTAAAGEAPTVPAASVPPSTPQTAALPPEAAPVVPSPPVAERRQLTVLCCELVDTTRLAEQRDPEDLWEVIQTYRATCAAVIQHVDGRIAHHRGGELLIYFGYPHAHDDDAQRAVWAGLNIVEAMDTVQTRMERERGLRLAVRLGIHTGLVIVDTMSPGRHDAAALGDTPTIAARLPSLAAPGTVVISQATYQLVQDTVVCQALGMQTLSGVSQPLLIYRVLGARKARRRLDGRATTRLTPFVGRDRELGLLLDRWEQSKDGLGQVVVLIGEAGIGKSRLVHVLKERVARETQTLVECRCSPFHCHSAFYPIIEYLHYALHWRRHDTATVKLRKLEATLGHSAHAADMIPLLAALLLLPLPAERYPPLTLSPQRQKHKTLEAILTLLGERAAQHPVLVIVEDLQYCDPSTLELLDLLIAQGPTARLLTLLTCRPTFQPPWTLRAHLSFLTLGRLSRQQTAQMITHVAGGKTFPATVRQQIVEKTDGVPLFVEELTRVVLESGLLQEQEEGYALTAPQLPLTIPTTLHDSLMARLDRLGEAKGIAQLAAVLGRTFAYEVLQAVAPWDETTLQHELARLVTADLLYQRGLPPQATCTFKHALIQEAAYQSLLKRTRQRYHQQIAQVLEAQFPEAVETQPELVAHHYTEAGLYEQAIGYWHTAGQRVLRRSASMEAIGHLTKGLGLVQMLPDTPTRAQHELDLQMALGLAWIATKGHAAPEVEHAFNRSQKLCQQVGEIPQRFWVLKGLHTFYLNRGAVQTARQLGEQCLSLAQCQHDSTLLLEAHCILGTTLFYCGELASAREHLEQGMTRSGPQPRLTSAFPFHVMLRSHTAWVLWMLGYPNQALRRGHEALALAQEVPHPYVLAFTLNQNARFHQFRREVPAVRERAEAAIALCTEQGFAFYLAMGTVMRGWALAKQGQRDEGIAQMRQGLAAFRATGTELSLPHWLALLAEAYWEGGHPDAGLGVLTEALSLVGKNGDRFYEAELHRLKGELLLQQSLDNTAEAESSFHQAIAIAQHQQAKSWKLRAAMSLSRLWQSQGKRPEAQQSLDEVYGWFTEGFDTADLQEAKVLLEELAAGA
jgi:class 3 adenylate cyclase/predicted ATPase